MEKFQQVSAEDVPDDTENIASFFPTSNAGKKNVDSGANAPPKGAIEVSSQIFVYV